MALNCTCTLGLSGELWKYAARAASATMLSSIGGGLVGLAFSLCNSKGIDVSNQISGILGSLVAIAGIKILIFLILYNVSFI